MRARARVACFVALVAALFCLVLAPSAWASEEILSFHADIQVQANGTLDVTETVEYRVGEASNIWGLFRRFPLTARSAGGELFPVTFNLLSVKRAGQATTHKLYRRDGMAELRIGDSDDVLPANSVQVYEIRYRTHGHIQESEQFDGLLWDVTGRGWPFAIRAASTTVFLPEVAPFLEHAAYTGTGRAPGGGHQVSRAYDGLYSAETRATLEPGEGFAVALTWPKGVVTVEPPTLLARIPQERLALFLPPLVTALTLFIFWLAVGRDPKRAPPRREFEPPDGMGPAAVRFLYNRFFDDRCFIAALLNMAVKGALRIVEETPADSSSQPRFRLEPLGTDGQVLTHPEEAAYAALFPSKESLLLGAKSSDSKRTNRSEAVLERRLIAERGGTPYLRNVGYTAVGGVLGLLAWLLVPFISPSNDLTHNASVQWLIAAGSFGIVTFFFTAAWFAPTIVKAGLHDVLLFVAIVVPVSAVVLGIAYWFILARQDYYTGEVDLFLLASGALFGFFIVLFNELLVAPTKQERKLLDRIEGLCLYLHGSTLKRPDYRSAPDRTPELFERLLPYAVALKFADDWCAQFKGVVGRDYRPAWYCGDRFDAVEFIDHFTDAMIATPSDRSKQRRNRSFVRLGASMSRWT